MYELPAVQGERLRSIWVDIGFPSNLRLFYAIGNFSAQRWEPGGRIAVDPSDPSGNTVYLSTGQRYNRASDGSGYLLLLVGHPGDESADGQVINMDGIEVELFDTECLAEGFDEGSADSIDWGDGELAIQAKDGTSNTYLITQSFTNTDFDDGPGILLQQPLSIIGSPEYFAFQPLVGDWNGDGADTIGFYDPNELNGARHPYGITFNGGEGNDTINVNASTLVVPPGGSQPNAIIAILIGLLGQPLSGATVQVIDTSDLVIWQKVSDARGRIVIDNVDDWEPGSYGLSLNFEKYKTLLLVEHEGQKYFYLNEPEA
jgi:hypothetical protein